MLPHKHYPPEIAAPVVPLISSAISPTFNFIRTEYSALYQKLEQHALFDQVRQGLSNMLLRTKAEHTQAKQWQQSHNHALDRLATTITSEIYQRQRHLPTQALQSLSHSPKLLEKKLDAHPTDYLCHFQYAWLASLSGDFILAERHFNIAALQSQSVNSQFSCFALRHLADAHYHNGKIDHALLALENARESRKVISPALQFEYIQALSLSQRTTQALQHLVTLIGKVPYYEILARAAPSLQLNPSFQRLFDQLQQQHLQHVQAALTQRRNNDPLTLMDLDLISGKQNSQVALQHKQSYTLHHMPYLLLFNEPLCGELIHQQSRQYIINTLNTRQQSYIQRIEQHQAKAGRVHRIGQWLFYSAIILALSLALSYGISNIAAYLGYQWPINSTVQNTVLIGSALSGLSGLTLIYFTPPTLKRLQKQQQQLEKLKSQITQSTR